MRPSMATPSLVDSSTRLYHPKEERPPRGSRLFKPPHRRYFVPFLQLPYNMMWNKLVIYSVVYVYVNQLLLLYYYDQSRDQKVYTVGQLSVYVCRAPFVVDTIVHLLHAFWPLLRQHVKPYRRSQWALAYDVISIVALVPPFAFDTPVASYVCKWLSILRIYRLHTYFVLMNGMVLQSRKVHLIAHHFTFTVLLLHLCSCLWYYAHVGQRRDLHRGFPHHIGQKVIDYSNYLQCFYYSTCRLFNTMFGDAYPLTSLDRLSTVVIMTVGYLCMRYYFIGILCWEMVLQESRRFTFVDKYHHTESYLKFHNAPAWLRDQTRRYNLELWRMKDGVLSCNYLRELPSTMQTELIFDINVCHLRTSLLFKDIDESYLRNVALVMRHEMYLEGQTIWHQGVVKPGMLCLKQGVIELLSEEDDESPVIAFGKGTILGELSLFHSIPAKVSIKAATYVELQILHRRDFLPKTLEQPTLLEVLRQKINTRLMTCKKRQRAIEKYDSADLRMIRTRYRPMKVLHQTLSHKVDEDAKFEENSHMYYLDENNVRKPKFITDYLSLYQLANKVTMEMKPRIFLKSSFPMILEPNTTFTRMLDAIHCLVVLYFCIVAPLQVLQLRSDRYTFETPSLLMHLLLLINIYFQLTTAIYDKNKKIETMKEITEVKMGTFGFYLDLLSVFPMFIFSDTLDPEKQTSWHKLAIIMPLLQVWHISSYIKSLQKSFYSNTKVLNLINFFFITTIGCYWVGVFLITYSCPRRGCIRDSWFALLVNSETKVMVKKFARHEQPVTTALAFATAALAQGGSTDLAPGVYDLWLIIPLLFVGFYTLAIFTANVCTTYILLCFRKLHFKGLMRELFYFLSVNHISRKIKERVHKFFRVQWYYNKAVTTEEMFRGISRNLQQAVLSIGVMDTLLMSPLFQGCSLDFLQTLALGSRVVVLPEREVVQHAADVTRDMYILQKGHCNMMNSDGTVAHSTKAGAAFGTIEMLYGLPKVHTVITTTDCILLQVEYSSLMQSLSSFPEVALPIVTVMNEKDLIEGVSKFEDSNPMSGKVEKQSNRITQEIKDSFITFADLEDLTYSKPFEKLGLFRFLKYVTLPVCVTPHGLFLRTWCILRVLVAVYYVTIIPYNVAVQTSGKTHGTLDFVDLILYFDLFVMAHVGYYNSRSLLVTHPVLTITHYCKTSLLMDLLMVLPFELISYNLYERSEHEYYRINKILQAIRIYGAFRYYESDIMEQSLAIKLLKYLPMAFTIVNCATAVAYINSCRSFSGEGFLQSNCTNAYVTQHENYIHSAVYNYATIFYWLFEVMLGIGCTPTTITNSVEAWLQMILHILGVAYFMFMFADISSARSGMSQGAMLIHKEQTQDLENFLYQENVCPMLTEKTMRYFEYVWKKTHGSNPHRLCRRLNSALMEDTLVFMYEKTLREVPLFAAVDRSFIRVVTQNLTEMYFLRGETVVQCQDIEDSVYIIYRGKVDVLSSYNEMITCMGPGGMFGNFTGPLASAGVSVITSRSSDLLVIQSEKFFNLIKMYPKIYSRVMTAFEKSKDYILPITIVDISKEHEVEEYDSDDSGDSSINSTNSSRRSLDATSSVSRVSFSDVSHAISTSSYTTSTSSYTGTRRQGFYQNLLRPGSNLFMNFGYLTCVLSCLSYVLVTYELSANNDCYILYWIHCVLDIYFYFKIYCNMHQTYTRKNGDVITSARRCRRRYFRGRCFACGDAAANLPLEMLAFCFPKPIRMIMYLRVNKILRLQYLIIYYKKMAGKLTNNIIRLQAMMIVLALVIVLHSIACSWLVYLTCLEMNMSLRDAKELYFSNRKINLPWDYFTTLYISASDFTQSGGDEFLWSDGLEWTRLLTIISITFGKALAALVVSAALQLSYTSKQALTHFEKKIRELIDVLRNQGLSDYQMKKLIRYVQQLWITDHGRQLPALLTEIPYARRCDLMTAMFGHHLRNSFLFSETSEPFRRQITAELDYNIYFQGNYVVLSGDSEARMFWVAGGAVSVVSVRADLTETVHELLGPGDMFGIVQGLSRGVPHVFSFRAESKVCILSLTLDSLEKIFHFFPEAEEKIHEKAQEIHASL